MADDPRVFKGMLLEALRRDRALSAIARVVGWEYLSWWSAHDPQRAVFGQTDAMIAERLGFSRREVVRARKTLVARGHLRFIRSGRASLVLPACALPTPGRVAGTVPERQNAVRSDYLAHRMRQTGPTDAPGRRSRDAYRAHRYQDNKETKIPNDQSQASASRDAFRGALASRKQVLAELGEAHNVLVKLLGAEGIDLVEGLLSIKAVKLHDQLMSAALLKDREMLEGLVDEARQLLSNPAKAVGE